MVSCQLHGGRVGKVLSPPRDGELDEARDDGSEDGEDEAHCQHQDFDAPAPPSPAAPAYAPIPECPQDDVAEDGGEADENGDQRHEEDIPVLDVGYLVGEDPLKLKSIQLFQQTGRDG